MINAQKDMDALLNELSASNTKPRLLLHSCCGPCSSYVLEYLSGYFDITVLYYNPNIYPEAEYIKRKSEQLRLIDEYNRIGKKIAFIDSDYSHNEFLCGAAGAEAEREGGERCSRCFKLRLHEAAKSAVGGNFDYFATTLTVSPHKNAERINEIGLSLEADFGVKYLPSDFKKKNGYKRSIELSEEYSLYRQHYCGCEFSISEE